MMKEQKQKRAEDLRHFQEFVKFIGGVKKAARYTGVPAKLIKRMYHGKRCIPKYLRTSELNRRMSEKPLPATDNSMLTVAVWTLCAMQIICIICAVR